MNEHNAHRISKGKPSLRGIYIIGITSTAIGIAVVMILNMATPIEYIVSQLHSGNLQTLSHWGGLIARRLIGLIFLIFISCSILCVILQRIIKPISDCVGSAYANGAVDDDTVLKAKQHLINLPFIMIPINIGFWLLIPAALFFAARVTGRLDTTAALTLGIRSSMVGFISSAIMSFWLESYGRRRLIPLFFPNGRLTEVKGTARISISIRIRLLYRLGSLLPLAILILTLVTLQWQVGLIEISAKEYGSGILRFSLVLFLVFFVGSSALNKLISRSIANPVNSILSAVRKVEAGNYETRIEVVSNDEIGILGDAGNDMIRGLAERETLRDAFGRYVAPEIRDEILSGRTPLDGELRDVTVLFADLRDFTPLTESNDPKLVVKILNSYFSAMSDAIREQSGLILQFLGDEIYAVFGAPVRREDHPGRAFKASLLMKKKLMELNAFFSERKWPNVAHGIGIHTGEVVAANIGSPDRLSYLLVGDTVNLASRLQSMTKEIGSEILISTETYGRLANEDKGLAHVERLPPKLVKGKSLPVEIFSVQ
jgi:class 3 adenylate cyclase